MVDGAFKPAELTACRWSQVAATAPAATGLKRRGAAAVEFALVLPLFVTIVLGCIDFGRFSHAYIAVSNAARAGAGHGMMQRVTNTTLTNWRASIRQAVEDEIEHVITTDGAANTDLIVTSTHTIEATGLWRVRVAVEYTFETVVPWPLLPTRVDLRRAVEMRGIR